MVTAFSTNPKVRSEKETMGSLSLWGKFASFHDSRNINQPCRHDNDPHDNVSAPPRPPVPLSSMRLLASAHRAGATAPALPGALRTAD